MPDGNPIEQAVALMDDLAAQEKTLQGKVSKNREFLRLAVENGILTEDQAAKVNERYPVRKHTSLTPQERVARAEAAYKEAQEKAKEKAGESASRKG